MIPTPIVRETSLDEPAGRRAAGLSIVVPVYNEGAGLASFHAQLASIARQLRRERGLPIEVVYIDDGSRDDSLAVAQTLAAEALDVQVVSLSRNFGKEAAMVAGLDHARLGAVLALDVQSGALAWRFGTGTTWCSPRKPVAPMSRGCAVSA